MTEELVQALGPLSSRSEAHGATPLDRISVRDHVRDVEIGAFQSERGVTQRIRFNVVLEVAPHLASKDDDVDRVVSYDSIMTAISDVLSEERIKLLETLAERIAARCLIDPRVVRVFLRVEKLDRIPGALGVEIVRNRAPQDGDVVRRIAPTKLDDESRETPAVANTVLVLPEDAKSDDLATWLRQISGLGPSLLMPMTTCKDLPDTGDGTRRVALLQLDQAAWRIAERDPRLVVAESLTEIEWAIGAGKIPVWAPAQAVLGAVPTPDFDPEAPIALASWIATRLGAGSTKVAMPAGMQGLLMHPDATGLQPLDGLDQPD